MSMKTAEYEVLEKIIDTHGVNVVLGAMSAICFEKSDHIMSNWQDKALTRQWEKAGNTLVGVQAKIQV